MYYVGVDLHKETSWFYVVDNNGKKVSSKNISNKPKILKQYFKKIPKPFTLAVEATYNWYYFVDMAEKKYLEQNLKKTLKSGEILFECTHWLKNGDTYHLISIKAFNIRNGLAELWH